MRYPLLLAMVLTSVTAFTQNISFNEILGRPTDQSVTVSVLFSQVVEAHFQYGTHPEQLTTQTANVTSLPETPVVADFQPLQADTRYYYRTVYKTPGSANVKQGPIRTFHTQRAPGKKFSFLIEADEHLYDKKGIRSLYQICLQNQALDSADFMLSLGDTFGDDHTPLETTSEDMRLLHLDYRQYLGSVCHSMPFFFCLGNHEGESGYWLDQTPPNNIAVYGTNWRKFYYPNPYPDSFYSGNMTQEPWGVGYPENYYAFTWGDALFVVLDVYRDCDVDEKPKNWDWTLGKTQYDWFKNTLENSTSSLKFVFAHHNRGQGRGGIVPARGFEWGGYGNNGNGEWEFDQMRPGWEKPIHQLMADNGVQIFFQGHDHLFALEKMDGVVYQEVPMPSDTSYQIGVLANADAYTDVVLDGSGHLRISVENSCASVDYVAAYLPEDTLGAQKNRAVRYSYKVGDCAVSTDEPKNRISPFFTIAPNPSTGNIRIKTSTAENHHRNIEVLDLHGRLLKTALLPAGETVAMVDLSDLLAGIYTVRINGDTRKFVLIH
ncbi:MAG: metallophosphoesterase [Saprospiraceae bacterium]|nr:metallophosphoesterase [Saprospiraceae bacterium]